MIWSLRWCLPALLAALAAPAARADCAHALGPASGLLAGPGKALRVRFIKHDDTRKEHLLARTGPSSSRKPSTPCIHCGRSPDRAPTPRVNLLERGDLLVLVTHDRFAPASVDANEAQPSTYHFLLVNDVSPPPKPR